MRIPSLLLIASALASCTTSPPSPAAMAADAAEQQARLAPLLAGKTAGPAVGCLPPLAGNRMRIIGPSLVAFEQSAGRVYLNEMRGSCPQLDDRYALVTRQVGTGGRLCSGEVAEVRDPGMGTFIGTCVLGDFIPYTSPGVRG